MKKTVAVALMLLAVVACKRGEKPVTPRGADRTATAQATPPATASSEVGAAMPEYTALNLDGSKFDLAAKRDKVVLLNVWATWCGPCRYEIPELQQLHEHYAPRGLEVVGVSVDESGVETVREFVGEQPKMTYPIVHDAEEKIIRLLETSVLPTSILVNRNGKIVWKKYGAILQGDEELKKAIEAAL
jgi:cytochrome c biogenesis protein CcmG, thiol:disulfide interchange protein DsbE